MDVIGSSFQMVRIRRRFWINHSSSSRSRSTHVFAHGPEMDPRPISFLHLSLRSPLAASTSVDAMAFASASPLSANPFKPLYPSPPRPSPRFAATQIVCQTSGESSAAFLIYRILSSTWCARLLDPPGFRQSPRNGERSSRRRWLSLWSASAASRRPTSTSSKRRSGGSSGLAPPLNLVPQISSNQ